LCGPNHHTPKAHALAHAICVSLLAYVKKLTLIKHLLLIFIIFMNFQC